MATRQAVKLTDTAIKNLKSEDAAYIVPDTEYTGYVCRVFPSGVKSLSLRYRDRTGKRERVTLGKWGDITAANAREAVKDILAKARLGDSVQTENREARKQSSLPTFREYAEGDYVDVSDKMSRRRLLSVFGTAFGKHRLDTITSWQIEKLKAARVKQVAASTVARDMSVLRSFWRAASLRYSIPNPMIGLKPVKVPNDHRVRFLRADEGESVRLREAMNARDEELKAGRLRSNAYRKLYRRELYPDLPNFGDHMKPMILLSLNTGIRRGELFKLAWDSVDLVQKRITVRALTSKGDKARHIPLNTEAANTLRLWKEQQADTTGLVFPSKDGKPFNHIKTAWHTILNTAKIHDFRWHDLRHDFASQLVMSGVNLYTVSKLLGHSSIEMTQRYAHLADSTLSGAVEVLNG